MLKGQLIRINAGFFDIECNGKEYRTRGSGNLRNNNFIPVVGDIVSFEPNGFLSKIHHRKNILVRPKVANVDQAIVLMSLEEPKYSSFLLNKFLAVIEFNDIEPIIVFTKIDLSDARYTEEYKKQGYTVFEIKNNDINTLEQLKTVFKNKLSVFVGQTGAGKTSTINSLTNLKRKTQEISKSLSRGKHTTRVVEIIDWYGGKLIDTPGFSSFEFNLSQLQLANSYKSFKTLSTKCKFRTCIHSQEPKCAIKSTIGKTISKQRYDDYLQLLKGCKNE